MASDMRQAQISGTGYPASGTVVMAQLFAQSGLVLIPVKCDSTGRIGSIF